jgi:hypothetical protein
MATHAPGGHSWLARLGRNVVATTRIGGLLQIRGVSACGRGVVLTGSVDGEGVPAG